LVIGQIVLVEVGKKKIIGIVLRKTTKPSYPTKSILSIVEPIHLPAMNLLELAVWLSRYYLTPLALVLRLIIPRGNTKKTSGIQSLKQHKISKRNRTNIVFNKEQVVVLETIAKNDSGTFLITGCYRVRQDRNVY
jgi:primosomal protein N'